MGLQKILWPPESEWTLPDLGTLPSWKNAKRVGLDTETCDPGISNKLGIGVRFGGFIAGVSFSIDGDSTYYLPIRHGDGTNLEPRKVIQYLKDQAKTFRGEICGANLGYDLDYLAEEGVWFHKAKFRDVQIADPLICELHMQYRLEAVAKRWNVPVKDEELLWKALEAYGLWRSRDSKSKGKSQLWKLAPQFVGPYAEWDAKLPLLILERQEPVIDSEGLRGIYDVESDLLPVLTTMRRRGIRIDTHQLDVVEGWSRNKEQDDYQTIKDLTGIQLSSNDVWTADAMAEPLRYFGLEPETNDDGSPSITSDFLEEIQSGEEFGESIKTVATAMKSARQANKLRTTFVQSIRKHMVNERIHCTLTQTRRPQFGGEGDMGAAFGRLSSSSPNMQQQPSRGGVKELWRSIYLPEEGQMWFSNDYSQQEPRLTVHYAELKRCPGAGPAADKYRNDPDTDNHSMMAEMTGLPRDAAKQIFLGKMYGMGPVLFAKKLGLPTEVRRNEHSGMLYETAGPEAWVILKQFDQRGPFVSRLSQMVEKVAADRGYIKTILGRRCRFPKDDYGNYQWTRVALNRLIQGSAADQTKKAMVEAHKAGFYLQLQVHDELNGSCNDWNEAEELAQLMLDVVPLRVPSKVDVECGESWGSAKGKEFCNADTVTTSRRKD